MALAEERAGRGTARSPSVTEESYGDVLVARTIRDHADRALRVAQRYSESPEDALDAYQSALLQLVRHKDRIRLPTAHAWLFETVRREALAVRERRRRLVAMGDEQLGALMTATGSHASAEERAFDLDVAARGTEALATLKVDELRALTLQASGLSYAEIGERLNWSATKTNRALTEGRRRFRQSYAELESGKACRRWAPVIAGRREATAADRARLRVHLRNCAGCRATARELRDVSSILSIVLPVAVVGASRPAHGSVLSRAGDGIARFGEALSAGVAERTAGAAFKLQALLEAASSAKLAAVAASAVALTGGGVAVREVSARDAHGHRHIPASPVTPAASTTAATRPIAASAARATRSPRATPPAPPRHAARQRRPEFGRPRHMRRTVKDFETSAPRVAVSFESAASSARSSEFSGPRAGGASGGGEFGG